MGKLKPAVEDGPPRTVTRLMHWNALSRDFLVHLVRHRLRVEATGWAEEAGAGINDGDPRH